MVERQRQRIEQEMTKMVDELDKGFLRKMQVTMHRCAAKCCENNDCSLESVQNCVDKCGNNLQQAQSYVQKEIGSFQNRLQRCVLDCNDEIKDKMGPNPSDSDIEKYNLMFEKCAVKCVDKHVSLVPQMMKAMRTVLSKQSSQS